MRRLPLLLTLVALTACAGSRRREPTTAELEKICEQRRCRQPTSLLIPVDDAHVYAVDFPASPWVAGPGLITLLPGERITITGTVDAEGRLQELEVIDDTREPSPGTIVLEFGQPQAGQMMLTVGNNFDAQLIYEIAMQVPMQEGLFETTAIPVGAHAIGVELWPHPIVQLVLTDFRFVQPV